MTLAELLVVIAFLAGLVWLLRPLRRWVTQALSRLIQAPKGGQVIEGTFRSIRPDHKDESKKTK